MLIHPHKKKAQDKSNEVRVTKMVQLEFGEVDDLMARALLTHDKIKLPDA